MFRQEDVFGRLGLNKCSLHLWLKLSHYKSTALYVPWDNLLNWQNWFKDVTNVRSILHARNPNGAIMSTT